MVFCEIGFDLRLNAEGDGGDQGGERGDDPPYRGGEFSAALVHRAIGFHADPQCAVHGDGREG